MADEHLGRRTVPTRRCRARDEVWQCHRHVFRPVEEQGLSVVVPDAWRDVLRRERNDLEPMGA